MEGSFTSFLTPTLPPSTKNHSLFPATTSLAATLLLQTVHPPPIPCRPSWTSPLPSTTGGPAIRLTPPSQSCFPQSKSRDLAQGPPLHPHCLLPRMTSASSDCLGPTLAHWAVLRVAGPSQQAPPRLTLCLKSSLAFFTAQGQSADYWEWPRVT